MTNPQGSLSRIRIIYLATTLLLAALSVFSFVKIKSLIDSSQWVNHTNKVNLCLQKISMAVIDAESNQKSFLLIGDSTCLRRRDASIATLAAQLNLVENLTKDNPTQNENIKMLRAGIGEKILSMQLVMDAYSPTEMSIGFKNNIAEGIEKANNVQKIIRTIADNEAKLLRERSEKYNRLASIAPVFIIVLCLGALLILLISYFRISKALQHSLNLEKAVIDHTIQTEKIKELQKIFAQAPVTIVLYRGANFVVDVINESALHMWGKTYDEVINRSLFDISPELRDVMEPILQHIVQTGEPFVGKEFPAQYVRGGKLRSGYFDFSYQPLIDGEANITGIVAVGTDVTEQVLSRKKIEESEHRLRELSLLLEQKVKERTEELATSEKKFYDLFNLSPVCKTLAEVASGNIILVNDAFTEVFGYSRAETLHKSSTELGMISPETRNRIINELQTKGRVQNEEYEFIKKSGEKLYALTSAEIIKIGNKEFYLGAYNDISDRKKAEKNIEQKNVELEKMNKELQSFAYISSHDLQEPLRKIQTFATRITQKEQDNLTENGREMFVRMQEAAKRMQRLIEDLLAYSRTNTAEQKFVLKDLNEIVEDVKEELQEELKETNALIETRGLCVVNIIPFQFRQLLHNLIGNALKFASLAGNPVIKIESEINEGATFNEPKLLAQKRYCHISISDNGIGFEQQYSNKIFEVFQRLHSKTEYKGTGIGLAIVKKIVDNHGGIITAQSELNKGARFDIYLPVS
ncbi:MAG: PAS domain S-box protein [Bacteroidota bacterium]